MLWGSEQGIRNFIPPPARGLDLGGRRRSVGDEDRSHSAPSNCTVQRQRVRINIKREGEEQKRMRELGKNRDTVVGAEGKGCHRIEDRQCFY